MRSLVAPYCPGKRIFHSQRKFCVMEERGQGQFLKNSLAKAIFFSLRPSGFVQRSQTQHKGDARRIIYRAAIFRLRTAGAGAMFVPSRMEPIFIHSGTMNLRL